MSSPERQEITAWFDSHGHATQALQAANADMTKATRPWATTPEDAMRDRTMTAARDLLTAVERCEALAPMDVPSVDQPFQRALADLRRGSEMLTSLPLDLDEARSQVDEASPMLQAGYDGIGATTQAALRFGPA